MGKWCKRILLFGVFAGIGTILYSYLTGKDLFPFQYDDEDLTDLSEEDDKDLKPASFQTLDDDLDDTTREYVSLEHTHTESTQEDLKK